MVEIRYLHKRRLETGVWQSNYVWLLDWSTDKDDGADKDYNHNKQTNHKANDKVNYA